MLKLLIKLDMPKPGQASKQPPEHPPLSVEEKVRQALELIDSGYCSNVHWIMINKLYKTLKSKQSTPRIKNLIQMIEPALAKYGYHKTSSEG
jgi:uncharacterized protein YqcC (DUF446 family)